MERKMQVVPINPDWPTRSLYINIPSTCPLCGVAFSSDPLDSYYTLVDSTDFIICSTYYCPVCNSMFMGISVGSKSNHYTRLDHVVPNNSLSTTSFSDNVRNVSERFIDIYNQSEQAEQSGFTEICGMGYRKSLEFLIKDYIVYNDDSLYDTVSTAPLSSCIANHIQDERIKALAKASAWIGNDEVHYVRKHDDYSVNDLKEFIGVIVAFIENELTLVKAQHLLSK